MSDQGYNLWGVVAGVLGTLSILPLLWDLYKKQMPTAKLRRLESVIAETADMLNKGVEEGLLDPDEFELLMWTTQVYVEDLRAQVYAAPTWKEEFRDWRKGLSAKIDVVLREVYKIRATIAQSSADERKKLAIAGKAFDSMFPRRKTDYTEHAVPLAEAAPPASASSPLLIRALASSPSSDVTLSSQCACSISAATSQIDPPHIDEIHDAPSPPIAPAPQLPHTAETYVKPRPPSPLGYPRNQRAKRTRPPSRREVLLRFGRQLMEPSPVALHSSASHRDDLPYATPAPGRQDFRAQAPNPGYGSHARGAPSSAMTSHRWCLR